MSRRDEVLDMLGALIRAVDNQDTLDNLRNGSVLHRARALHARAFRGLKSPLPWTPFERVSAQGFGKAKIAKYLALVPEDQREEARAAIDAELNGGFELFVNSRYRVWRRVGENMTHLSVKRIDQEAVHDWRDLQRIKDELIGPENEAVELYPAAGRLTDTANQYHLWAVNDPAFRFPFGFSDGITATAEIAETVGAHQRPREDT